LPTGAGARTPVTAQSVEFIAGTIELLPFVFFICLSFRLQSTGMKIIISAILFFTSTIVSAQIVIKANDPGIRYDLIQPGVDAVKVVEYDSLGNKIQTYISKNYIAVDKSSGLIKLTRLSIADPGILYIDTSIINVGPVTMHSLEYPARKELHVKFEESGVTVKSLINGVSKTQAYPMPAGYFDDNILVDIIGYLPIEKEVKYIMDAFRFESVKTNGLNHYEVQYLHDDYLPDAENKYSSCKVLYFKNGYSDGYIWVDKSSHKILKQLINFDRNKHSFLIEQI
jgi:hypothetical protein